jgi:uncharacterized membrane protein
MALYKHKEAPFQLRNVNAEHHNALSLGDHVADATANLIGSWKFIVYSGLILLAWIVLNAISFIQHWDSYPFQFLNLGVGLFCFYSAPLIMMSQNRQSAKDHLATQHAYEVNVNVEHHVSEITQHLETQDYHAIGIEAKINAILDYLKEIEETIAGQDQSLQVTAQHIAFLAAKKQRQAQRREEKQRAAMEEQGQTVMSGGSIADEAI